MGEVQAPSDAPDQTVWNSGKVLEDLSFSPVQLGPGKGSKSSCGSVGMGMGRHGHGVGGSDIGWMARAPSLEVMQTPFFWGGASAGLGQALATVFCNEESFSDWGTLSA